MGHSQSTLALPPTCAPSNASNKAILWSPFMFPPGLGYIKHRSSLEPFAHKLSQSWLPVTHMHESHRAPRGIWFYIASGCSDVEWFSGNALVARNQVAAAMSFSLERLTAFLQRKAAKVWRLIEIESASMGFARGAHDWLHFAAAFPIGNRTVDRMLAKHIGVRVNAVFEDFVMGELQRAAGPPVDSLVLWSSPNMWNKDSWRLVAEVWDLRQSANRTVDIEKHPEQLLRTLRLAGGERCVPSANFRKCLSCIGARLCTDYRPPAAKSKQRAPSHTAAAPLPRLLLHSSASGQPLAAGQSAGGLVLDQGRELHVALSSCAASSHWSLIARTSAAGAEQATSTRLPSAAIESPQLQPWTVARRALRPAPAACV